MKRRAPLTPAEWNAVVFPVADMYVSGLDVKDIVESIRKTHGIELGRQQVHRALVRAREQGLLWVSPPRTALSASALQGFANQGDVQVAHTEGASPYHVATAGAEVTYRLIQTVARQQPPGEPVHIGLGIGRITRDLAAALAAFHRSDLEAPDLVLHAMAVSFGEFGHEQIPSSYPSLFAQGRARVRFVPLDAEPLVAAAKLPEVLRRPYVKRAFKARDDIQIVVSSIASSADEHSCLQHVLKTQGSTRRVEGLRKKGWIGDVQLRPYASDGPLRTNSGTWPLTLFEIPDLVRLARTDGRHVVVLAGPCAHCGRSKADALRPLLANPSLRVWNHLVVDERTAAELEMETGRPTVPPKRRRRSGGGGKEAAEGGEPG